MLWVFRLYYPAQGSTCRPTPATGPCVGTLLPSLVQDSRACMASAPLLEHAADLLQHMAHALILWGPAGQGYLQQQDWGQALPWTGIPTP